MDPRLGLLLLAGLAILAATDPDAQVPSSNETTTPSTVGDNTGSKVTRFEFTQWIWSVNLKTDYSVIAIVAKVGSISKEIAFPCNSDGTLRTPLALEFDRSASDWLAARTQNELGIEMESYFLDDSMGRSSHLSLPSLHFKKQEATKGSPFDSIIQYHGENEHLTLNFTVVQSCLDGHYGFLCQKECPGNCEGHCNVNTGECTVVETGGGWGVFFWILLVVVIILVIVICILVVFLVARRQKDPKKGRYSVSHPPPEGVSYEQKVTDDTETDRGLNRPVPLTEPRHRELNEGGNEGRPVEIGPDERRITTRGSDDHVDGIFEARPAVAITPSDRSDRF